ncbi:putative disease resistance RPP13-like protein 1 [Carex rostrata]
MPAHLRQLSNLQTLTTYIVGDEYAGTGIDEIKGMHLGGLLELYNLRKVKTPAIAKEADLFSKTNLDRLTLCWGSEQLVLSKENTDFSVLEDLRPHSRLKVLKIQQYGGREFASWLVNPWAAGLVHLVELHLIGCSQCETLPAVWKLLSLRVLCLKHMPSLTCIIRVDKKYSLKVDRLFPSLKRLVLVGLKRLERWQGGAGATCSNLKTTFEEKVTFRELFEVEINSCPNLKTMPCLPSLKRITASIENYRLLQSITYLIIRKQMHVEEANIAKASNDGIEPFPTLGAEGRDHYSKLRVMRMDSTNSFFMPTTLPRALKGFWSRLIQLRYLDIFNCNTLVFWPPEFKYLKYLIRLSIRKCPNLIGILPAEEEKYELCMSRLLKLELYGCSSLKQLPQCRRLCVLELDECPEVKSVSSIWLRKLENGLDMLYLSCTSWTSLPTDLGTFDRLGTLWVSECYNLTSFPDELAHVQIDTLIINECLMVKELPEGLDRMLSSLKKLTISKCPQLEKFCKEGPYSAIISQMGTTRDDSPSTN